MTDFLKNIMLIDRFSRLLKALSVTKVILTVVIIAFSVITGAKYLSVPQKIE